MTGDFDYNDYIQKYYDTTTGNAKWKQQEYDGTSYGWDYWKTEGTSTGIPKKKSLEDIHNDLISQAQAATADKQAELNNILTAIAKLMGIPFDHLYIAPKDLIKQIQDFVEKQKQSLRDRIQELEIQLSKERQEHANFMDRIIREEVRKNEASRS